MSFLRRKLKRWSFGLYRLGLRGGMFVVPAHYYVPMANALELEKTRDAWAHKSELPGIHVALDEQADALRRICGPHQSEVSGNPFFRTAVERHFGPGYGYIEAQALHGVIRHYRPETILEVGSGVSTYCALQASKLNEKDGRGSRVICVEPYPSRTLQGLGEIELIRQPVQQTPLSTFTQLKRGDLLFIDSSHTVRPGGDVNFLFLEVLPRLAAGVVVHVHDIYFPYDYPRDVLWNYCQWMETSLLRAFLIHNAHAKIVFCLSHLHYDRPEVVHEVFPEYRRAPDQNGIAERDQAGGHFPASIYFEIC